MVHVAMTLRAQRRRLLDWLQFRLRNGLLERIGILVPIVIRPGRPLAHLFAAPTGSKWRHLTKQSVKMRIGISALYIRPGKVGGVERVLYPMLKGFAAIGSEHEYILYANRATAERIWTYGLPASFSVRVVGAEIHRFVLETAWLPFALRRHRCDVIWFPNYFLPPTIRTPAVVTVHDLQYKHLPQYFSPAKRRWLDAALSYTMRYADAVTSISHASAADIAQHFGRQASVIYNPLDDDELVGYGRDRRDAGRKAFRLLVIAHQYPHKNIETVVNALGELEPERFTLDIVGHRDSGSAGITRAIESLARADRVRQHGYVSREQLLDLLAQTDVFLFPSTFEGFGIPVIEALALGVPVIASDLPVLREISDGSVEFVGEPLNPGAWASAIEGVCSRVAHRAHRVDTAAVRQTFSARRIASQYLDLFKQVGNACGKSA